MSFAGFWLSFIEFAREAHDSVLGYLVGRGVGHVNCVFRVCVEAGGELVNYVLGSRVRAGGDMGPADCI